MTHLIYGNKKLKKSLEQLLKKVEEFDGTIDTGVQLVGAVSQFKDLIVHEFFKPENPTTDKSIQ